MKKEEEIYNIKKSSMKNFLFFWDGKIWISLKVESKDLKKGMYGCERNE